ncbi:MAG: acetyl-CoA carboxylase carboxyl transferase subunit alpha, partial [Candidatus Delongbacteria bacterium]|nr:acetyl-CoA carboxylase carboxyl transferase subunit alpha [Candidatus Delongbacteria bacterium]
MSKEENSVSDMEKMLEQLKAMTDGKDNDFAEQIVKMEKLIEAKKKDIYSNLTPWETVKIARHPQRPVLSDYIKLLFSDFIE